MGCCGRGGLRFGRNGVRRGVLLAYEPLNMHVNPLIRTRAPQHAPGRGCPRTSHRVHVRIVRPTCRSSGPCAGHRANVRVKGPACVWALRCAAASGRGRDQAHARTPGPRILTPRRVPTQHVIGSVSDENHSASAQVDTIDDDDVMNLIDDRTDSPSLPQRLTTPTKRAAPARHIRLTAPTEQPGQKIIKMLGRGVYVVQRRDCAGCTPPALTT